MLWAYGHCKYMNSFSAGIDLLRQNLTSTETAVHKRQVQQVYCMSMDYTKT